MQQLTNWFKRQIANPQVVYLATILLVCFLVINYAAAMLAPVFASIVLAYLLDGLTGKMTRVHVPRALAVWVVFCAFLCVVLMAVFIVLPVLYDQFRQMVQQIPEILASGQAVVMTLPQQYPDLFSVEQTQEMVEGMRAQLTTFGQNLLTRSLSSAASLITVLVYLILLPILVFFFLRDKARILNWFSGFVPRNRELAVRVWGDVDAQIGNYIRGKVWEIFIVWLVSFLCFSFFDLQFAMLLAALVGISVLIPYVGAAVVTIPVVLIAWFQWGWSSDFLYVVVAYLVIQALDGNLLVPLLFSEVVNLHPVAIIVAVLVCGGLWGVWGVFFAIPLATAVHAVIVAWPKAGGVGEASEAAE